MPQIIHSGYKEYNMHTKFTIVAVDCECPKGMNEQNCPLRDWLKTQNYFKVNASHTELRPTEPLFRLARAPYVHAIEQMNQICRKCQEKTK